MFHQFKCHLSYQYRYWFSSRATSKLIRSKCEWDRIWTTYLECRWNTPQDESASSASIFLYRNLQTIPDVLKNHFRILTSNQVQKCVCICTVKCTEPLQVSSWISNISTNGSHISFFLFVLYCKKVLVMILKIWLLIVRHKFSKNYN